MKTKEETITIEIKKTDAKKLWYLLKNAQENDNTRLKEFKKLTPEAMNISERSRRQFMALLLSEIHIIQNVMRAIEINIPTME